MDEETLNQAIELSKMGRSVDARKLLRPLLEVEPENEKAWLWYANSFDLVEDKIKALRNCLHYCPNSKMAFEGVRQLQSQLDLIVPPETEESADVALDLRNTQGVTFSEPVKEKIETHEISQVSNEETESSPFVSSFDRLDQIAESPSYEPKTESADFSSEPLPAALTFDEPAVSDADVFPFTYEEGVVPIRGRVDQGKSTTSFRTPFILVVSIGIILLILLIALLYFQ